MKYNPATTSVDEWTSADTGIGATIAIGSQIFMGYDTMGCDF